MLCSVLLDLLKGASEIRPVDSHIVSVPVAGMEFFSGFMCVWTSWSFVAPWTFGLAVFRKVAFINLVVPQEEHCRFIVSHFAMDTFFMVLFLQSENTGSVAPVRPVLAAGVFKASHQPPRAAWRTARNCPDRRVTISAQAELPLRTCAGF